MQTNHKERRKILVVPKMGKVNHQITASGMSWNLKVVDFITSGTDKGDRIELEDNVTNKDKKIIV